MTISKLEANRSPKETFKSKAIYLEKNCY